ncbi:cytochrome C assembly protein [Rhodoferax lacus]|uniref:Cytochrome C assembly protein n=1 Tax=Rhodoferax lacus TaxID=2184758 RepID=A0A3E1R7H6_9BURK|nr:cytochrome c biogenesis protein CcsA [Rhodoferax lacus]RFO95328.1 cytochrome C assembly protein [Rhodoferax lacus]
MILASASPLPLILSVLAALAYLLPAALMHRMSVRSAHAWVAVAWLLQGILLVSGLLGEPPHFGFAPALSVTAWLVAAVYAIESLIYPQLPTRWTLSTIGAAAVLLAYMFPGGPMSPSTSVWLPLHLAFGIACYGLFGIAVVHAWFMNHAEKRIRQGKDSQSGLPLLTLERLTYRFVAAGFVLLSATLVVGMLFGEVVYGHAWRWDHKTVFSVLSWLTFAVLLVGRTGFGWRGKRAATMLYTGSAFLLLAYVGSRFVMEIVLSRTP